MTEFTRAIIARSVAVTFVCVVVASLAFGQRAAFAVLAGGLLVVANFRFASGILRKIILPGGRPGAGKAVGILLFLVRHTLVGGIIYLAIRSGVSPVFLLMGLSTLIVAVFLFATELKRGEI